jgi:hypothetical protein
MTGKVGFPVVIGSGTSVMGYVIREEAEEVKKRSGAIIAVHVVFALTRGDEFVG